MNVKALAVIVFLSPVVIFVAQNYEVVEVKFLTWSISASRSVILFAAFALGVVVGSLLSKVKRSEE